MKNAESISGYFCNQVAALPWRKEADGTISLLLVTSRRNAKWMLPKGWPWPDKTEAQSALKEAKEEAGVKGTASEAALGSYHYKKLFDDGSSLPAQAVIYSVRVDHLHPKWLEMKERKRRWFSPHEAAQAAFEPDLSRFLGNVARGRVVLV